MINIFKRKGVGMKTIKDFIGRTNFVVKAKDPSLKKTVLSQWESHPAHDFPKLCIFILSVRKYTDSTVEIYYINQSNTQSFNVVVPNTFEVSEVTSPLLLRIMDKHTISNLHRTLHRLSMTIGSDPEMFVEDENGKVIPAFNFLGS